MAKRRAFVLLFGLAAFVLASAIAPHLHAGTDAGLWNAEHDLSLMATFGGQACPPDAMPSLGLMPAPAATIAPDAAGAESAPLSLADSRGPPRA